MTFGRVRPRLLRNQALPSRAQIEQRAAMARRVAEEAALLTMQHEDFVMVVNGLRIPIRRQQRRERRV